MVSEINVLVSFVVTEVCSQSYCTAILAMNQEI